MQTKGTALVDEDDKSIPDEDAYPEDGSDYNAESNYLEDIDYHGNIGNGDESDKGARESSPNKY